MCGRFLMISKDELNNIIAQVKANLANDAAVNVKAQGTDAFPKANVPIIVPENRELNIQMLTWGYPNPWGKDVIFNTRADTATDGSKKQNMWRDSLANRRCLIPTCGFYEPHKTEKAISQKTGKEIKQQYYFRSPESNVLLLAGIYELGHFSIMTTEPNRWMQPIHNRMPVVLRPGEYDQWLHGDYTALFDRTNVELIAQAV